MTEEETLVCEHGLRAHELSAWRDGDLSAAESHRVGDHVAECPSARARLADYESVIAALRAQRVPTADQRLWQRVSARAAARPPRARLVQRHPLAVALGTLGTLAALIALVIGFARLFLPGPPSQPASYRGWTAATFPRGFTLDFGSLAVVDATHAYACVTPLDQQQRQKSTVSGPAAQFWVTSDRGATWTRKADLPILNVNQCSITVDDLNPNVVTIWGRAIPLHSGGLAAYVTQSTPSGSGAAVTFDGGVSWQQPSWMATNQQSVGQHATANGISIAIVCCSAGGGNGTELMVSHDHMRTWQPIDETIIAHNENPSGFVVESTGTFSDLVVISLDTGAVATTRQHLWVSTDGGTTWTSQADLFSSTYDFFVAQAIGTNKHAEICAELYPPDAGSASTEPAPSGITCSLDGGTAWGSVPLPPRAACVSPQARGPRLQAIAPNGDLYMDDGGCTDTLYRLRFTGDTWQPVISAPAPRLDLLYAAGGAVWTMARLTDSYTQVDPTGIVYVRPLAP